MSDIISLATLMVEFIKTTLSFIPAPFRLDFSFIVGAIISVFLYKVVRGVD